MYKKILVGVDGSKESNKAVKKVIELKQQFNCEVVVFHSVRHHFIPQLMPITFPIGLNYNYRLSNVDADRIREDYNLIGKKILADVKALFQKENLIVETRLDVDENPEEYIKKVVPKEGFDLIVLGYRGHHSKLRNAVIGSVPEKILEDIDCDLLIIK